MAIFILSPSQPASVFRMETQMVDCEPHRGVQLICCIDTRVLANLLSQASATSSSLRKLVDLRAPARISPAAAPASFRAPRANRGWNSVLTASHGGNAPAAPPSAPSLSAHSLSAWTSPTGPDRISHSITPSQSITQPVAAAAPPSSDVVPDNWKDES
jgi:hypothetical protein